MAKYVKDFRQGDDVEILLSFDKDITGYKFWFTLKNKLTDLDEDAALQTTTIAGDNSKDDPLNGIVYIPVSKDLTALLENKHYYYDIQSLSPEDELKTIVPLEQDYMDRIFVVPKVLRNPI